MEYGDYLDGVPSWVDMGSGDLEAAKAFYGALFGWETPDGPPEAGGYTVCTLRGRPVAGLGPQMNPTAPPAWMTFVNVIDAEGAVTRASANGGTVLIGPMTVMTAGTMAVFADNVGAVIGIWQPGDHRGAGLVNEPGTYTWSELITTDVDASKAFYSAVFGWEAQDQGEAKAGEPPAYTEWKVAGNSIAGMMAKSEMMPADMPPNWGVYFAVDDCDAAVAKVKELGGSLVMGPMEIEPGRFAVLVDPVGAVFNVITMQQMSGG
jgi:hypothetical protein